MVTRDEVMRQLNTIKAQVRFWSRAEIHELEHILVPGEIIMYCLGGRYEGGFAVLCATDMRILLIDKKPLYLTLEDIRYDMISEVDFSRRLVDSTISIHTVNKQLRFTSTKGLYLRKATSYIQGRVMEFRQHHMFSEEHLPVQGLIPQQDESGVKSFQHRITNPYTRVPLVMRRRTSRFYSQ